MANGLGIDCVLYYNSGTFGSPTWVELSNVLDVQVGGAWNSGDGSSRATRVIKEGRTRLPLQISGRMLADKSTGYVAMRTAYYASGTSAIIDVMVLDGPSDSNGADGFRFEAEVHDFSRDEGADNVVYRDFVLKPSIFGSNAVQSVVVASGSPVFTTLA